MAVGLRRRWIARRDGGGGGGLGEEMLAGMLRQCCDSVATVLCHTAYLPSFGVALGGDGGILSTGLYLNYFCPRIPACCVLSSGVPSKPHLFAPVPFGTWCEQLR